MANVNDDAFAAVDAFYGVDSSTTNKERQADRHAPPENAGGKRLGVGFSRPQETGSSRATTTAGATSSRRILQVGSKKRRRNIGYGDDEDDEDVRGGAGHSSSDDDDDDGAEEEEQGRTAIDNKGQKLKPASSSTDTRALEQPEQQKKKLGKKERQRLAREKLEKVDHAAPAATAEDSSTKRPHDNGDPDEPASNDSNSNNNVKKNKRKRRKVRSRQKNIYKDNRDVKPDHLVPGKRDYQGRPLTQATRAKLNMPVIRNSPFASDRRWAKGNWNDNIEDFDDDHLHTDNVLDAMPLAVDQVTRNEEDQVFETSVAKERTSNANQPKRNTKDKTKKKSSKTKKYKNLL